MKAEITVTPEGEDLYRVTVTEGASQTLHLVGAGSRDVGRLGGGVAAEALVAAAFRFLLDREPKESILGRFDLTVISRYFPDFEARIGEYL